MLSVWTFKSRTAYICEVTTHLRGVQYKNNQESVNRITKKYRRQREYAKRYLGDFPSSVFMFWSPRVPKGYITEHLERLQGLDLIINQEYSRRIDELRAMAKETTQDTGDPSFRILQILEHLRR